VTLQMQLKREIVRVAGVGNNSGIVH
jgi:hypothetical protein